MKRLRIYGLPKRRLPRGAKVGNAASSLDLVRRRFHADGPDCLWMTDIIEHPTGGTRSTAAQSSTLSHAWSFGWSIDSRQTGLLVTNALGMALKHRAPREGGIIRSDQGTQFGSWVFSQKGLAPSVGAVGPRSMTPMVKAFWARMQVELLNRRRWKTRLELATAIHDYIETWHNTRRRHSALNMLTPTEFENNQTTTTIAA